LSPLTDSLAFRLAAAVLIAFGGLSLEVRQAGSTTVASSYEPFAVAEVADGQSTPAAQTAPTETTVYAPRTGTKYHRAGCRHLSRSQIPMSLRETPERYGPCSVCKPPSTRAGKRSCPTSASHTARGGRRHRHRPLCRAPRQALLPFQLVDVRPPQRRARSVRVRPNRAAITVGSTNEPGGRAGMLTEAKTAGDVPGRDPFGSCPFA
jgi:hypothetical protein